MRSTAKVLFPLALALLPLASCSKSSSSPVPDRKFVKGSCLREFTVGKLCVDHFEPAAEARDACLRPNGTGASLGDKFSWWDHPCEAKGSNGGCWRPRRPKEIDWYFGQAEMYEARKTQAACWADEGVALWPDGTPVTDRRDAGAGGG
jgi:hypothetical protein